ncbi:hypothetical protein J7643_06375 [bacterium]|nr:hypothetical protein [bacterium]
MRTTSPLMPLVALMLAGCATSAQPHLPSTLSGTVAPFPSPRHVAATSGEIAQGATVSLIDPISGNTLVTALTRPDGRFVFTFDKSFKPSVGPYFLEAAKGLSVGASQNRPSVPAARMRTLISNSNGLWASLTGPNANITLGTTALCALSNLKGLDQTKNLALLGRIDPGLPSASPGGLTSNETFTPPLAWISLPATESISVLEFLQAWNLVGRALALDADPMAALMLRDPIATASPTIMDPAVLSGVAMAQDGWALTSVKPATASTTIPSVLTVRGIGLPTATDSLLVTLNGATCSVLTASATGSDFTVRVPAGIPLGARKLVVTYGPWSHQGLTVTIQ